MTNPSDFIMQDGCPWVDLRRWSGSPNLRWCEDQVCGWIATPANTWSNLAYIAVGFFFFWLTRKEKAENLRFYGVAAQWVGWTSFIYHASLTFATQLLDFVGMFVFLYLMLVQNFARLGFVRSDRVKNTLWLATAASTVLAGLSQRLNFPIQGLVAFLILAILFTEALAARKSTRIIHYRALSAAVFSLGVAAAFSAADVTRRFCDPSDHLIQGHALWHYFGSISLLFSIYHYRQFYSRDSGDFEPA